MDETDSGGCRPGFGRVGLAFVAVFCLVDVCALTFRFVEGDDSRAVAYSLLGVNNGLYAPMQYHSMTSMLLSLLPKQESVVRVAAIGGTALGALFYLLLVARVAWHWAARAGLPTPVTAGVLIGMPLIVPEFLFLGLLYEPIVMGMSFVLLAHLVVRPAFAEDRHSRWHVWRILAGALLFGFGVSFRWDAGFYGTVIAVDLLITGWKTHTPMFLLCKLAAWGIGGLLATLGFLSISGYAPSAIVELYQWTKESAAGMAPPVLKKLAHGVTFLTPATLLLLGVGVLSVVMTMRRSWPVLLLLTASVPLFVVAGCPSFTAKAFLTVMPALVLVMLHGAAASSKLYEKLSLWLQRTIAVVVLLLLFVPWLVGIQWKPADTVRGPGFVLSPLVNFKQSSRPRPAFAGGLCVPTPEGSRPFWGFGWVLIGGEWRDFVRSMNDQWNATVDLAIEGQLPIHQDSDTGIVMARLMAQGYALRTPRVGVERAGAPKYVHHRLYEHHQSGAQLEVIFFSALDQRIKNGAPPKIFTQLGFDEVAVVYAQSSRLYELQAASGGSVLALSPLTAIWKKAPVSK